MRLVKEEAICLLVHEQEYGTAALYVHSTRPITKLLPAKVLESVDVQPQRALNFTLVPPFNGDKIQQAMNYCCSTQVGFNAALVQREINLLTIFEDPTSFLPPNLANWFTVCSVFGRDVSSEVDRPLGVIQIQGPLSGAQELDIIQATLQARPEVVANKVTVNANSSGITVEPRHNSELLVLKEVVLETLRDLGIPHGLGRSHLVLYKVGNAPVLGQCAAEVEVSPSPDCGAGYANLSSCDVVYKVLPEMGYSGRLRRTHDTFAFDLVTPKCKGCAHKIASALLKPAPGGVDYSRISLTLSRNVLLVSPTTDPGPQCIRHVTAVLLGLGIATSVLFAGPADRDLVDAEDMQSQYQLYTQPVRAVEPPSSSTNILEVALREGSISCPGCGEQVQKLLPALRNVVVDQARSVVMLEHATEQVAEVDVVNRLETLGYQPKTLQKGKQLLSAMHTALANRPAAPVPTPDTSESETLPGTELAQYDSLLNMSCVAAFTAKVYLSPDQPATTTTIMLGCHPDAAADELGYHLFIKSPTGEVCLTTCTRPSSLFTTPCAFNFVGVHASADMLCPSGRESGSPPASHLLGERLHHLVRQGGGPQQAQRSRVHSYRAGQFQDSAGFLAGVPGADVARQGTTMAGTRMCPTGPKAGVRCGSWKHLSLAVRRQRPTLTSLHVGGSPTKQVAGSQDPFQSWGKNWERQHLQSIQWMQTKCMLSTLSNEGPSWQYATTQRDPPSILLSLQLVCQDFLR